jgi:F-type H+-transporting ATPase subunit delta
LKPVKEAKRYAKTLINIVGMDDMPAALTELATVAAIMAQSKEFRNLLENPGFSGQEKEKALTEVAARLKLSSAVVKFCNHLAAIRVIAALPEIIKAATALYLERKKRAKAVVMTPVDVAADQQARLKAALKQLTDRDVDIDFVHDPTLLGGVLVKVGSTMYDSSIRGQLRLLKDELIKG